MTQKPVSRGGAEIAEKTRRSIVIIGNDPSPDFRAMMCAFLGKVENEQGFRHTIRPVEIPKLEIPSTFLDTGFFYALFLEDSILNDWRNNGFTRQALWSKYSQLTRAQIRKLIQWAPRGQRPWQEEEYKCVFDKEAAVGR